MIAASEGKLTISLNDVLAIERAAVHAWPAAETRDLSGWLWRYSGGGSQRANSVSPLAFHGTDTLAAIREAEEHYYSRNAPCRFQVGELCAPPDLDEMLSKRGYRIRETLTTLAKLIAGATVPQGTLVADRPGEGWMQVYLSNITADRRPAAPSILASVPRPCAFLAITSGGQVVSTALAVLHEQVVIAECIGTRTEARRTGAASKVMAALEGWGAEHGAKIAALQAVTTNHPAQALYSALGYEKVNAFHYRVRDR